MDTPEIHALFIDQSEYWDDDILKYTGRIFDVYIYNDALSVYACSLTPCVEAYFIETWVEKDWADLPWAVSDAITESEAQQRPEVRYEPRYMLNATRKLESLDSLPNGRVGWMPLGTLVWKVIQKVAKIQDDDPMEVLVQALRERGI